MLSGHEADADLHNPTVGVVHDAFARDVQQHGIGAERARDLFLLQVLPPEAPELNEIGDGGEGMRRLSCDVEPQVPLSAASDGRRPHGGCQPGSSERAGRATAPARASAAAISSRAGFPNARESAATASLARPEIAFALQPSACNATTAALASLLTSVGNADFVAGRTGRHVAELG